jgi:hypothetical protein
LRPTSEIIEASVTDTHATWENTSRVTAIAYPQAMPQVSVTATPPTMYRFSHILMAA